MNDKSRNQIKYGALISYVLIIANALFGIFVTPFILKYLGDSSYGVYKTMGSLSSSLLILDLGIGGTLMRYIAKYRANAQDDRIGAFISIVMCETGIILPCIALAEFVLYAQIDAMYSKSFSQEELLLAKSVFVILALNILLNIIENFLNGIISGYNDFIFANSMHLMKLTMRILLILVVLPITQSALFLVTVNLILSVVNIVIQLIYILTRYRFRLTFDRSKWEKGIFKESFFYTLLIFLTTIAAQVNGNLDNVIIGAFCGSEMVTVYSFGLVIFSMFEQLSTAISGVALPTVSKIVTEPDWQEKVQAFIIKLGRVQFALLGAVAVGFAVLGNEFLGLWLGDGFGDVYYIVLILMIPSLFELCVNVCLSVLRAKNMLGFRTTVLVLSTLLNLVVSIAGIKQLGYFSAALGTAASFTVGSLIVMNIYYYKKLNFNMLSIYGGIVRRTLPCLLIAGGAILLTSRFLHGSWLAFVANGAVFVLVYGALMLIWGFSEDERNAVTRIIGNIMKKRINK